MTSPARADSRRPANHLAEIKKLLVGMPISHVWRGYGSAIFIEFGNLHIRKTLHGSTANPAGDVTLQIEWSWRIENPRSILAGSWSSDHKWQGALKGLLQTRVTDIALVSTMPEIQLSLCNGKRALSFMTAEGQPAWAINSRLDPKGSWSVKNGAIQFAKTREARSLR